MFLQFHTWERQSDVESVEVVSYVTQIVHLLFQRIIVTIRLPLS